MYRRNVPFDGRGIRLDVPGAHRGPHRDQQLLDVQALQRRREEEIGTLDTTTRTFAFYGLLKLVGF